MHDCYWCCEFCFSQAFAEHWRKRSKKRRVWTFARLATPAFGRFIWFILIGNPQSAKMFLTFVAWNLWESLSSTSPPAFLAQIDCKWSAWSSWSGCSASCGGGRRQFCETTRPGQQDIMKQKWKPVLAKYSLAWTYIYICIYYLWHLVAIRRLLNRNTCEVVLVALLLSLPWSDLSTLLHGAGPDIEEFWSSQEMEGRSCWAIPKVWSSFCLDKFPGPGIKESQLDLADGIRRLATCDFRSLPMTA